MISLWIGAYLKHKYDINWRDWRDVPLTLTMLFYGAIETLVYLVLIGSLLNHVL